MTDDTIAGIVFGSGAALIAGGLALYWRQRLRFTRGTEPVVACSVRWWNGPLGLGWRQGLAKLGKDRLAWRRRLTFRSQPQLILDRSRVKLVSRRRPDWQSWWWISSYDVLTLDAPGRRGLDLGVQPDDADLVLDWLGTPAERPPARVHQSVSVVLWLVWLAAAVLFWGSKAGNPWVVPGILIVYGAVALGGGLIYGLVWRRRLESRARGDEFVNEATDVFGFLRDFGFDDAYVQHFPWQTTLAFTGTGERLVVVTLDRRLDSLDVRLGRRGDSELRRLSDVLADAGHEAPDRITRITGEEGPMRKALDANAHALRLWGRPFLVGQAGAAGAATGAV